jgi:hypothetical protein
MIVIKNKGRNQELIFLEHKILLYINHCLMHCLFINKNTNKVYLMEMLSLYYLLEMIIFIVK